MSEEERENKSDEIVEEGETEQTKGNEVIENESQDNQATIDNEVEEQNETAEEEKEESEEEKLKKKDKKSKKSLKQQIATRDDYHTRSTRAMTKELQGLTKSLRKMARDRVKSEPKPFTPNIYNNLQPYYNTNTTWFLFKHPEPYELTGHGQRATAISLVEPEKSLNMDARIQSIDRKVHPHYKNGTTNHKKLYRVNLLDDKMIKLNSIHFPKIQPINLNIRYQGQYVDYRELPKIRDQLRRECQSRRAKRQQIEGKKVLEDFERLKINDLKTRFSATSQVHMRSAVTSYFGPPSST